MDSVVLPRCPGAKEEQRQREGRGTEARAVLHIRREPRHACIHVLGARREADPRNWISLGRIDRWQMITQEILRFFLFFFVRSAGPFSRTPFLALPAIRGTPWRSFHVSPVSLWTRRWITKTSRDSRAWEIDPVVELFSKGEMKPGETLSMFSNRMINRKGVSIFYSL